jgi:GNAT superfamily N-acetyltransferase
MWVKAFNKPMTNIVTAVPEDIPAWIKLAAEVEPLFGPMVNEPSFLSALQRNIARGTAFCVRDSEGNPGVPLIGGLIFSPKPPIYKIGWLVVTQQYRRQGIGKRLVEQSLEVIIPPAELVVTTFGEDNIAGKPARRFYEHMGLQAAESAPNGPEGGSRQIFRRIYKR